MWKRKRMARLVIPVDEMPPGVQAAPPPQPKPVELGPLVQANVFEHSYYIGISTVILTDASVFLTVELPPPGMEIA